jgi:hypothetical protein
MSISLVGTYKGSQLIGEDGSVIHEYSGIFGEECRGQKFLLQTCRMSCRCYRVSRIIEKREGGETFVYDLEPLPNDEQNWLFWIIWMANL